jgi:hypothetical protein
MISMTFGGMILSSVAEGSELSPSKFSFTIGGRVKNGTLSSTPYALFNHVEKIKVVITHHLETSSLFLHQLTSEE